MVIWMKISIESRRLLGLKLVANLEDYLLENWKGIEAWTKIAIES